MENGQYPHYHRGIGSLGRKGDIRYFFQDWKSRHFFEMRQNPVPHYIIGKETFRKPLSGMCYVLFKGSSENVLVTDGSLSFR